MNITFVNNSANYGPDIGSYPVKIVQKGTTNNKIILKNIPSGIALKDPLEFDLIDFDGQKSPQDSVYFIKVTPIIPGSFVRGNDYSKIINGTAKFTHIMFGETINAKNIPYRLSSKQIPTRMINALFNNSEEEFSNLLIVSFRS